MAAHQGLSGCAGEMGLQEPHGIKQRQIPSSAPVGKESLWQEHSLGTEGLQEASCVGKAPEVLSGARRGCAISIEGAFQIWIRQKPEKPDLVSWLGRCWLWTPQVLFNLKYLIL